MDGESRYGACQMASSADEDYVLVEHGFEYVGKDGALVSIKPHERYLLVKKTNEHWWQVCRHGRSHPFYVPAKYVRLLSALSQSPGKVTEEMMEPVMEYSYRFLPAEPPAASVPHCARLRRYDMAPSSHSLSDIPALFQDNGGSTLAPLRTFLDPLKRIGLPATIRPSQSLSDLRTLSADRWLASCIQNNSRQPSARHVAGGKEAPEAEEAVYVNVKELQRDGAWPRSQHHSSASTIDDWETHTDHSSGQHFYYNCVTGETTWDCPFEQVEEPLQSPIAPSSPSPTPEESDWEKHFDESSAQFFFYNPLTGDTSWEPPAEDNLRSPGLKPMFSPYGSVDKRPPTPEADYPEYSAQDTEDYPEVDYSALYAPPSEEPLSGWSCHVRDGRKLYISDHNGDTWVQSEDRYGKTYFYTPDGSVSQWTLPQLATPEFQRGNGDPDHNSNLIGKWSPSYAAFAQEKATERHTKGLEKAGVLQKTKSAENGKRLRKNWSSSWTVLEGGILTFFKDSKNLSSNSLRQSVLTSPEYMVRLLGASLSWASRDKSSKKHVMELKTQDGSEYLIHHDSEAITTDWFTSISKSIGKDVRMSRESTSENEAESLQEFGSAERLGIKEEKRAAAQNSGASDSERNVRAKLRKFLLRRPTLQSLKDKGYIRDQVFGCDLHQLCEWEKRSVPHFVTKCIQAVERRGLDIDGLYRISGNLAVIQKLRYKADHDENLNLEDGKWEDVHVITGALKLFFRELPEPLFCYSHFNDFIQAIKLGDQMQKIQRLRELVLSLPAPNLETMKLLFRHLCSVIEHKESNRMSVQSVAIVFGPTLLRPEEEGSNIAMYMVFQNQIVEQILVHYKYIFSS